MLMNQTPSVGMDVQGIVNSYTVQAGSTISAGDFVEFVNAGLNTESDNSLVSDAYANRAFSASALDDTRVFISYSYGSYYRLYGALVTISGTTITIGTSVMLSSVENSGFAINSVGLSSTRVFVVHSTASYSYYLGGTLVNISGSTITVVDETIISTTERTGRFIDIDLLSNGSIFVAHSYSTPYYLYGIIITITGDSVNYGTDTLIDQNDASSSCVSSTSNNRALVSIALGEVAYVHLCSVSGSVITVGTRTYVYGTSASSDNRRMTSATLSDNRVLLIYPYTSVFYVAGNCIDCGTSGITVTVGTNLLIDGSETYIYNGVGVNHFANGIVVLLYSNAANTQLRKLLVIIGTSITVNASSSYSTATASYVVLAKMPSKKFFILRCISDTLYGSVLSALRVDKTASVINGLAKTSGTSGTTVQVIEPII